MCILKPSLRDPKFATVRYTAGIFCLAVALVASPAQLTAQVFWDDGGPGDDLWSSFANWSDNGSPNSDAIEFRATGAAATAGAVTNIVDQNFTIDTLWYNQNGASLFHTTQINNGITLTANQTTANTFLVADAANTGGAVTQATITGAGTFTVSGGTGGDFVVGAATTSATATLNVLDMSGLATFNATVDEVRIAASTSTTAGRFVSQVRLANTNTITTNSVELGVSTFAGTSGSFLRLGQTNVMNTDTLTVGGARMSATLEFDSGLTGTPTFTLRNRAGTGAVANVWIGDHFNSSGEAGGAGGSSISTVVADFTAGSIDWSVGELHIGNGASSASGTDGATNATFSFDAGTLDVSTNLRLGRVRDRNADTTGDNTTSGTLNMEGGILTIGNSLLIADNEDSNSGVDLAVAGTFNQSGGTATVGNDIQLATHDSATPSARNATAELNLTGGSLTVTNNILTDNETTNITTITLDGGSLDMTGGNIGGAGSLAIDNLNLRSGTLANIGQISGGAAITKTTVGTLILAGTNTYTGATNIDEGTLLVNGTHTGGGAYTVASGATLGGSGSTDATINLLGQISPGNSPGMLSTGSETWNNGASYLFEIDSASGSAGTDAGWDLLNISGTLNLAALSVGGFTIDIDSLLHPSHAAGPLDVLPGTEYVWDFLEASGGITGFDAGDFAFDLGGFTSTEPGAFQVRQTGNSLELVFTTAAAVPEPASVALWVLGALAAIAFGWQQRNVARASSP